MLNLESGVCYIFVEFCSKWRWLIIPLLQNSWCVVGRQMRFMPKKLARMFKDMFSLWRAGVLYILVKIQRVYHGIHVRIVTTKMMMIIYMTLEHGVLLICEACSYHHIHIKELFVCHCKGLWLWEAHNHRKEPWRKRRKQNPHQDHWKGMFVHLPI